MGLCQPCKKIGRVTKFYAVDHIVSRALAKRLGWSEARTESPENCQCICDPCHKTKTEEEQGKKKNPPKQKIGADGWPIE
jgi:5-methylcytosine-specific restriction protein A